ncbi:hypothetical protein HZH68_007426 [Vespula germanica]|uniref:Uncharacterized protein n=1 Tax=Vespula germanica TaxID=30212 RepID=A0A834K9E7_VESGE|nr:hypothetical protein HZH68_007426 [Vespula germanica]
MFILVEKESMEIRRRYAAYPTLTLLLPVSKERPRFKLPPLPPLVPPLSPSPPPPPPLLLLHYFSTTTITVTTTITTTTNMVVAINLVGAVVSTAVATVTTTGSDIERRKRNGERNCGENPTDIYLVPM